MRIPEFMVVTRSLHVSSCSREKLQLVLRPDLLEQSCLDAGCIRILPYFQEEMMVQENPIELEKTMT